MYIKRVQELYKLLIKRIITLSSNKVTTDSYEKIVPK